MRLKMFADKCVFLVPTMCVLFMFFLPLSPSLKSIFFGLAIATILLIPYYNKNIWYAYNTLWGRLALLFFTFIVLASLWSPAPYSMQMDVIGKYCKLIYLPVLAVGFMNPKTRTWAINAYILAMIVTFITCILKLKGIIKIGDPGDPGDLFYNHIITGFMMAVACYLAVLLALKAKGWLRAGYWGFILIGSYQILFINNGRTGYIMYFILVALLLVQKLSLKKALLGLVLFSAAMILVFSQSQVMQEGAHNLANDIKLLQQQNKDTSLGYRIQFHHYAQELFLKHPIIGLGTGSFKYSFSQDKPVPSWGEVLNDPHSQYWMLLAEQGVIGLALFLLFLGGVFFTSFQLPETKPILLGILVAFCIGCLSDTILCFSTAGYLLIVICAMCFGELIGKRKLTKAKEANQSDSLADNDADLVTIHS